MDSSSFEEYPQYTTGSYSAITGSHLDRLNPAVLADDKPRVLLMGLKRCGKSSILKVVFEKMSPHQAQGIDSTSDIRIKDVSNTPFFKFQVWDFPGKMDLFDPVNRAYEAEQIFKKSQAVIFVIDAQDDPYAEALDYFVKMASQAYQINPNLLFEIFIHKIDGDTYLSEDIKSDCFNDIQTQLYEELQDQELQDLPISYYLTTMYDHSIFEAFSKVVQKLFPQQLPFLENLLDSLISSCVIEKAFLFDVVSKLYLATDSNPVDMQTYELCSDMIDVVIDVSCIYGLKDRVDVIAYDSESTSVIRLSTGYVLYLREVNKLLALVCLMREDSFNKSGLVEFNITCFKQAITELFEARRMANQPKAAKSAPKPIKNG